MIDPEMRRSMGFSPNGAYLATGSDELSHWWNTETCASEWTAGFRGPGTYPVAFDRYGTFAAAASDGKVGMWNHQLYGDDVVVIYTDGAVNDIQFGPKGLLATAGIAGNVQLWSALTGEGGFIPLDAATEVWDIDFNSNGELLASLSDRVRLWDIGTAQLETDDPFDGRDLDGGVAGQLVLFSPDGSMIATTYRDGTLLADVRK